MKHIKYFIGLTFIMVMASCDIDDIESNNLLLENTVIVDEASAVNMLNRIYNSGLRNRFYGDGGGILNEGIVEYMSTYDQYIDYLGTTHSNLVGFNENKVLENDTSIEATYIELYSNINLINFFIELIEHGNANVDSERENELIAEGRFFRALAHFNLLRIFGQFYDLNSPLGVVVRLTPKRDNLEAPRNSVQESYNAIIADLQFAVDNAASGRDHFYVSATTARALLAKVQLYAGDYTNAATNALSVINNSDGYGLNPSFDDIFVERYGSETLLAAFIGPTGFEEGNQGSLFSKSIMGPTNTFIDLADAQDGISNNGSTDFSTGYDPRFSLAFDSNLPFRKYPNGLSGSSQSVNTIQALRMGEIYLIYAEAEARRSGGVLPNALARLNEIRDRAGVTTKILTDQTTLLEDIRQEKVLELYAETAEHWFDLVRYHALGNIDALSVKPTLTSINQFILPIPINAILGNSLLAPNP